MQRAALTLAMFTLLQTISSSQTSAPTPHPDAATFIMAGDVQDVLKAVPNGDHDLKSVDIGKLNESVGVVAHSAQKPSDDGSVVCIGHHGQTETYVVISGSGTLVTGGTLYDVKEVAKDSIVYTTFNGPSFNAKVKDGDRRVVNVGDIVIIPPDICHGWAEVPDHVIYLTARPDPERSLPAGYVNPNIKK